MQKKAKKALPFLFGTAGVTFVLPPLCGVICEKTSPLAGTGQSACGAQRFGGQHPGLKRGRETVTREAVGSSLKQKAELWVVHTAARPQR